MDKRLLRQALKFKDNTSIPSQTKYFNELAKIYEQENDLIFTYLKQGKKSKILDWKEFFLFLSEKGNAGKQILSFNDIDCLLAPTKTRQENIENTGDSKSRYIKVFDKVVIYQNGNTHPQIYSDSAEIDSNDSTILAIENGETFLRIYSSMSDYGFDQFVYLGGMSNSATRDFLKDKNVTFFLDYDIEAIRIYDSFECQQKSFFKHPELEKYFSNSKYRNEALYRKQLASLPESHTELQWLIDLIKEYSAVMEQEVF